MQYNFIGENFARDLFMIFLTQKLSTETFRFCHFHMFIFMVPQLWQEIFSSFSDNIFD